MFIPLANTAQLGDKVPKRSGESVVYISKDSNKVLNALQESNVIYIRKALLPNSSEMRLTEHQNDVLDLLPTQGSNASHHKDNNNQANNHDLGENNLNRVVELAENESTTPDTDQPTAIRFKEDKEKALDWLVQQRAFPAEVNSPIKGLDSVTKVVENFENPKDKATIFHKEAIDQEAELQNSKKAPLQNSDALSSSSPLDGTVHGNPGVSHVTQPDGAPLPNDTSVVNSAKLKKKTCNRRIKQEKTLYV